VTSGRAALRHPSSFAAGRRRRPFGALRPATTTRCAERTRPRRIRRRGLAALASLPARSPGRAEAAQPIAVVDLRARRVAERPHVQPALVARHAFEHLEHVGATARIWLGADEIHAHAAMIAARRAGAGKRNDIRLGVHDGKKPDWQTWFPDRHAGPPCANLLPLPPPSRGERGDPLRRATREPIATSDR